MSMAVGGTGRTKSDINMTPMIDVLLVLIIIFMVITPLAPKGLSALIPQPSPSLPGLEIPGTVVISVSASHSLAINRQPVDLADLQVRLRDIFKTRSERVVFVASEPNVEFSWVARVIDLAHGAGIDKVGLMPHQDLAL